MRKIFVPALVLAASALAGAGLAAAEGPGPDPMGPPEGMSGHHGMGPDRGGFMHRHWAPGAHLEGRLAFLKTELKITSAQEGAWSDFAAALRKSATIAEEARGEPPKEGFRETPVPAKLDLAEKMLTARLDALKAIKVPTKKLYDALDDTQKKSADELFWGPMGVR